MKRSNKRLFCHFVLSAIAVGAIENAVAQTTIDPPLEEISQFSGTDAWIIDNTTIPEWVALEVNYSNGETNSYDGLAFDITCNLPAASIDDAGAADDIFVPLFSLNLLGYFSPIDPTQRTSYGLSYSAKYSLLAFEMQDNLGASNPYQRAEGNSGFQQVNWKTTYPVVNIENLQSEYQKFRIILYVNDTNSYLVAQKKGKPLSRELRASVQFGFSSSFKYALQNESGSEKLAFALYNFCGNPADAFYVSDANQTISLTEFQNNAHYTFVNSDVSEMNVRNQMAFRRSFFFSPQDVPPQPKPKDNNTQGAYSTGVPFQAFADPKKASALFQIIR